MKSEVRGTAIEYKGIFTVIVSKKFAYNAQETQLKIS